MLVPTLPLASFYKSGSRGRGKEKLMRNFCASSGHSLIPAVFVGSPEAVTQFCSRHFKVFAPVNSC